MVVNPRNSPAEDRAGRSRGRGVLRCPALVFGLSLLVTIQHVGTAAAGPTFTHVTAAEGITHIHTPPTNAGPKSMSGGAVAADFDGDGLTDLFFTQINGAAVLYHNTGGSFENISAASGFTENLPASGAAAGDVDNDGDLDLMVMGMQTPRHYLFINDGAGHFTEDAIARGADVSVDSGPQTRQGHGVALGDYDRDGYLDILTSEHSRSMSTSGSRLLRNLGATSPGHFEDVTHAVGLDVYRQGLHLQDTAYRFTPQFS